MPARQRIVALALVLSACQSPAASTPPPAEVTVTAPSAIEQKPSSAPAAGPKDARSYTFDGFKLGSLYGSTVMTRAPYNAPCDNDPIDQRSRRFMVYGALPCRDRTFPQGTTVMFYLAFSQENKYDQPIVAFAWLGGDYFESRSDFPVRTGVSADVANSKLGAPLGSFALDRKGQIVTVQRHRGDVHVVLDGGKVTGFVVGPMPQDPENEQWRGLMQMYVRYTKPREPPPSGGW